MMYKYVQWGYGKQENFGFEGYIPALEKEVVNNPWQLYQWAGLFTFSDGQTRIVPNYDVFNVKKTSNDENFSKENGFGLVYKSEAALSDLFDSIWSGQPINVKQRLYFREQFVKTANDPIFKSGHEYYYTIQYAFGFLRTSGIVPRMGIKFNSTQKISADSYRALYDVSPWPKLTVSTGDALNIAYTSYGYSERDIRVIAAPKGAFPNLSNVVSLTGGKLVHTDKQIYDGQISFNSKAISKVLGKDVDIIIDDGYGRTAIKSITLPEDQAIDFVPTKLTLTESGQLWVKMRYEGDDIITSDSVSSKGFPMLAAIKIGGAITSDSSLASMFNNHNHPTTLMNGQELSYMLGKVDVGDTPGKYYIKVDTTINNPSHPDRALESPVAAYNNNTIHGEWLITRKAPETDLIAHSVTVSPSSITLGNQAAIKAVVKNSGTEAQSDVLIRFFDNTKRVYEVRKSFAANETKTVGPFNWTGQSTGVHNITVSVDPDKEKADKDRSNNVASTGCSVTSTSGIGNCNAPEASGSWSVTYPVITGYPTKYYYVDYTDSKGMTWTETHSYTDYSDPIWENRNVNYNEFLTISAEVNTKQGIATDPDHPKNSDRESRGSWEIIPYSKKNGKSANEITRAGYGIELTVKTDYKTNWETLVPSGLAGTASAIGGSYYGPDKLYATFYNPNGKLEKTIELERTAGDRNRATWELPKTKITSESGKTYMERKYMTSVNAPDGYYRIKISTDPAGMKGLITCITKQVEIYGSMYDDVQNVRRTN